MTTRLHLPRKALALLAGLALLGGGATGAVAGSAFGQDTSAVAVNTKDGSSVFKLAFSIKQVVGDTVDNQNAAVAYASCTSCQTVAISIQVLLIAGDPSVFTPGNYAIAINQDCTLCDTLASAYQFAVGIGTRLKFTADGRQQIAEIRRELQGLRKSGLSGPEIQARVDGLMHQLSSVLSTQLIGVNEPAAPAAGEPSAADSGQATSSPTDTATTPSDTSAAPATTTTDTTPADTTPAATTTTTTPADTTTTTPADTTTTAP